MGSDVTDAELSLRERKKQRTRRTIARVALELFAEHGFHDTTIRQIADAADVSPRTVSGYFPSKEELLFTDHEAVFTALSDRLEERRPGESAVDALRDWIATALLGEDLDLETSRCRRAVIESDPALRTYERGLQERFERIIAAAVATDLGLPPDDLVPRMVGAATMAALDSFGREAKTQEQPQHFREEALALVDEAMTFIGAGVQGLAERRRLPGAATARASG